MKNMNYGSKKFSKAFTIAEAIVCFLVMGFVFIGAISGYNTNKNYYKLYYTAFDTLLQIAGNANLEFNSYFANDPNHCYCSSDGNVLSSGTNICWDKSCWTSDANNYEYYQAGSSEHTRDYPGFLYSYDNVGQYDGAGTDEAFCKLITKKLNLSSGTSSCKSFVNSINEQQIKNDNPEFLEAFCYQDKDEDGNVVDSTCNKGSLEPTFVASNGQKFYLSSATTANAVDFSEFGDKKYTRKTYRFVVVDINGNMGPNSQLKKGKQMPDLVLFAITDSGFVVPLGLPEFNKTYINAFVKYPKYTTKIDPKTKKFIKNTQTKSEIMSLFDAKRKAFGLKWGEVDEACKFSMCFKPNEQLSYSSLFYANSNQCADSKGSTCTDKGSKTSMYVDSLYAQIVKIFTKEIQEDLATITEVGVDEDHGCMKKKNYCRIDFEH